MNTAQKQESQKGGEFAMKLPCARINQGWNFTRRQHRASIHQDDVAAHAQPGRLKGKLNGPAGFGGVCHECRTAQDAALVQLDDCAIHALRQAKIVRVNNDSPHRPVYQPGP